MLFLVFENIMLDDIKLKIRSIPQEIKENEELFARCVIEILLKNKIKAHKKDIIALQKEISSGLEAKNVFFSIYEAFEDFIKTILPTLDDKKPYSNIATNFRNPKRGVSDKKIKEILSDFGYEIQTLVVKK